MKLLSQVAQRPSRGTSLLVELRVYGVDQVFE